MTPLLIENQTSTSKTFDDAMKMAKKMSILKQGDLVVETAGTLSGVSGSTDLVKVGIVSSEEETETLFI